jgi:energy-converting hydrogenase Eha subunit A
VFLVLGLVALLYVGRLVHIIWEEKSSAPVCSAGEAEPRRLQYSLSSYFPSNLLAAGIGVLYGLVIGPFLVLGLVVLSYWMITSVQVLVTVPVLVIGSWILLPHLDDLRLMVTRKLSGTPRF